jgi:hypothetical protein
VSGPLARRLLSAARSYQWRGHSPAWTISNQLWGFLRLMTQFRNTLVVTILPPHVPSDQELQARRPGAGSRVVPP